MYRLANKHILLGISGGIAAYKSAELVRRLREAGADVRVVMTSAAQEFITPLTLQALSGNPVSTSLLDPDAEAAMGHIELARWADLILVAPATANFMAKMASGQADDLLSTLILASSAGVALAPAMNQAMWSDVATQANLQVLLSRGIQILGPAAGDQACGDVGLGRMLEPEAIRSAAADMFETRSLDGCRVLITAGPTREAIDPVRFISNHSSGKMGFALAEAAAEAGAITTLISGPVALQTPPSVQRIDVTSAADMLEACVTHASTCDLFIATAAVADYRPSVRTKDKIKKDAANMQIELTRTTDIVATIAQMSPRRPYVVGFAAETRDVIAHASEKLKRKGLDMIVANDVADASIGFNSQDNQVTVIWSDGQREFEKMPKDKLARLLITEIAARLKP